MFLRPLPTDIFLLGLFEFFNKYIFSILKRKSITGYCSFKHTTARSHCKFGASQNSEVSGRTGNF